MTHTEEIGKTRRLGMNAYRSIIRPILFSGTDPEFLHHSLMNGISWLSSHPNPSLLAQLQSNYSYQNEQLIQKLWGLNFPNPVGLAAGFDKDGQGVDIWSYLGFGFAELGTVTYHAQEGNPRPRLFRLIPDRAILNRMGFNNHGSAALAARLHGRSPQSIPIGINLGKSKTTPLAEAGADYLASFELLRDWGDYFVVNVSSPNTPELRSLQHIEFLEPILRALQCVNPDGKPILVKIAPDLANHEIHAIVDLALRCGLAGIVATNTTTSRLGLKTMFVGDRPLSKESGGISGLPLRERSTEVIRLIYQQTQGQLPIIGVGGIANAAAAWEKITAGASLLQIYTGLVYEGPGLIKEILIGLQQYLQQYQCTSIQQAVGMAVS